MPYIAAVDGLNRGFFGGGLSGAFPGTISMTSFILSVIRTRQFSASAIRSFGDCQLRQFTAAILGDSELVRRDFDEQKPRVLFLK